MQRVCKAGTEEAISLYPKALNQDDGTGVSRATDQTCCRLQG